MENLNIQPDPQPGKTENMIQEYAEKVAKALELETNRLKEKTEQDSARIITEAREKANSIIARAKQAAKDESEKIIAQTKEEAEQIFNDSMEKAAAEGQRLSAGIIRETREKAVRLISEVIDGGMTQAKDDFVRAASESKSLLERETSKLLNATNNIGQLIGDTETKLQAGFEQIASVMMEMKQKMRSENELPDTETIEASRQPDVNTEVEMPETAPPADEAELIEPEDSAETEQDEEAEKSTEQQPEAESNVNIEVVKKPSAADEAASWMRKGVFLMDRTKNKEAVDAFNQVIKLEPENALAWRKKGAALGRLGKYNDALRAFTKAIELDPNDVTAWQNKVMALTKMGKKAEAEEAKRGEKQAQLASKKK